MDSDTVHEIIVYLFRMKISLLMKESRHARIFREKFNIFNAKKYP